MLAINTANGNQGKIVPNLLPCSIKHSGPVNAAERYWNPSTEEDGSSKSYFRGRKLLGRKAAVPQGYHGVLLEKTDKVMLEKPSAAALNAMEDGDDNAFSEGAIQKEVETKSVVQQASFEEIVIWDHEAVPEEYDLYVKGMQEWIGFAEAMHSYDTVGSKELS